jgi:hypothetical protein
LLGPCFLACGFASGAQTQSALDRALASFLADDPREFEHILKKGWTPPASAEARAAALASYVAVLPQGGEIKDLKNSQRRKLASARPVLTVHSRQTLELRVIAFPQAYVGLHGRAIILVSISALDLLSSEELQAIVAHEASHDTVWPQWESARERKDFRFLEELELYCDGIALLTLHLLGIDLSRWVNAIEKIDQYNQRRFGQVQIDGYPSFAERKKFAQAIICWLGTFDQPQRLRRRAAARRGVTLPASVRGR